MGFKDLTCSKCSDIVTKQKHLIKTNEGCICKKCNVQKRKQHREFLKRDILGIRKRTDLLKEWKEKRKKEKAIAKKRKEEVKEIKKSKFNVKGYKAVRVFGRKPHKVRDLGIYITRNEKVFLHKDLINKGYTSQEANERIKVISQKMAELSKKLNKEKRKKEDLNIKFKEEFAKLIEQS